MKKRINLYLAELRPQQQLLGLPQMMLAWCAVLLVMVLMGGVFQILNWQTSRQQAALQLQLNQLNTDTQQLNEQLAQRHPDEHLMHELTRQQEEYRSKQQLQLYLNQIGNVNNQGFAAWLYDLAQARTPDVALQMFDIENGQIRLQGEAVSNDAVPAWLSRFGDYPKLRERMFTALEMQRQKSGVLQFTLESRETSSAAATGKTAQ